MAIELEVSIQSRYESMAEAIVEADRSLWESFVGAAAGKECQCRWLEGLHRQFVGEGPIEPVPDIEWRGWKPEPLPKKAPHEEARELQQRLINFYSWAALEVDDSRVAEMFDELRTRERERLACELVAK